MPTLKRVTETEEISTIFKIDDDRLEKNVPCTKAEWIQFLLMWAEYPEKFAIFGLVDDEGNVQKYFACINAVMPPISKSVLILYQNFYSDHENGLTAFEMVKQWARECGAEKICIQTMYPRINSKFGFEPDIAIAMVLDL